MEKDLIDIFSGALVEPKQIYLSLDWSEYVDREQLGWSVTLPTGEKLGIKQVYHEFDFPGYKRILVKFGESYRVVGPSHWPEISRIRIWDAETNGHQLFWFDVNLRVGDVITLPPLHKLFD